MVITNSEFVTQSFAWRVLGKEPFDLLARMAPASAVELPGQHPGKAPRHKTIWKTIQGNIGPESIIKAIIRNHRGDL